MKYRVQSPKCREGKREGRQGRGEEVVKEKRGQEGKRQASPCGGRERQIPITQWPARITYLTKSKSLRIPVSKNKG